MEFGAQHARREKTARAATDRTALGRQCAWSHGSAWRQTAGRSAALWRIGPAGSTGTVAVSVFRHSLGIERAPIFGTVFSAPHRWNVVGRSDALRDPAGSQLSATRLWRCRCIPCGRILLLPLYPRQLFHCDSALCQCFCPCGCPLRCAEISEFEFVRTAHTGFDSHPGAASFAARFVDRNESPAFRKKEAGFPSEFSADARRSHTASFLQSSRAAASVWSGAV